MNLNVDQKYVSVLIIQSFEVLGVLLGFYKLNVQKYDFGNLTSSEQA